jgi:hypothetical protein
MIIYMGNFQEPGIGCRISVGVVYVNMNFNFETFLKEVYSREIFIRKYLNHILLT